MPKKRCETNFAKKKKEILENEIFQEKSFLFPTHITYRSFSNELKITVTPKILTVFLIQSNIIVKLTYLSIF